MFIYQCVFHTTSYTQWMLLLERYGYRYGECGQWGQ